MKKLRFVIFVMLIMLLLCSAARAVRSAPEARVAVAHGQMSEKQLEKVMVDAKARDIIIFLNFCSIFSIFN